MDKLYNAIAWVTSFSVGSVLYGALSKPLWPLQDVAGLLLWVVIISQCVAVCVPRLWWRLPSRLPLVVMTINGLCLVALGWLGPGISLAVVSALGLLFTAQKPLGGYWP